MQMEIQQLQAAMLKKVDKELMEREKEKSRRLEEELQKETDKSLQLR